MPAYKPLSDLGNRHAVRKIFLHEPFNRPLTFDTLDVSSFSNPQLLVFRKSVVRLAGVKMRIDEDASQKFNTLFQSRRVIGSQHILPSQRVDV